MPSTTFVLIIIVVGETAGYAAPTREHCHYSEAPVVVGTEFAMIGPIMARFQKNAGRFVALVVRVPVPMIVRLVAAIDQRAEVNNAIH